MKTRIMFYLLLVALFGFSGNLFAMEETKEHMDVVGEPSEIETPQNYEEIIGPQGSEVTTNTFYGLDAGLITTGKQNSFFGWSAGLKNTTGHDNSFFGWSAGNNNTTGIWNTFIGSTAGHENTTGIENVFIGQEAGYENTEGEQNIFIGYRAGYHNETAWGNVFIGSQTGTANETGIRNAYVGYNAGLAMTSRSDNTLMGYEAGAHVNANRNTFFGSFAGASSFSGGSNYANSNTFIGAAAGKNITEGDYNTFVGDSSGRDNTEGSDNVFVGYWAGYKNKSGEKNTALGYCAGFLNASGEGNVFLGHYAGATETGSNKLYIDNRGITTPLIWGDFNTNNVVIYGGFRAIATSISSDRRLKEDIKPLESSLSKVSNLQAVTYEWKTDEYPEFGLTEGKQIGLIAQDVEKVLPELVSEDKDGYKAVSYSKLTAVLVEAVKELKNENQERERFLLEKIQQQQAEIEALRNMITQLNS